MQHHKSRAWGLLILILGLDGMACWAMLWQRDVRIALVCLALSMGLLLTRYALWRGGR